MFPFKGPSFIASIGINEPEIQVTSKFYIYSFISIHGARYIFRRPVSIAASISLEPHTYFLGRVSIDSLPLFPHGYLLGRICYTSFLAVDPFPILWPYNYLLTHRNPNTPYFSCVAGQVYVSINTVTCTQLHCT